MSNWMKNTRTWLGLGNEPYYEDEYGEPGDDYDDYDEDYVEEEPAAAPRARAAAAPRSSRSRSESTQRLQPNVPPANSIASMLIR